MLLLLITIALALPPVQKYLIQKGVSWFSDTTGGTLTVGSVDIRLPWYIALNDVTMLGSNGEHVASIGAVQTSIGWRMLFTNTIRIDHIAVMGLSANVHGDSTGRWNYDFITDAFAGSDDAPVDTLQQGSGWDFSIGEIEISASTVTYYDAANGDSFALEIGGLKTKFNDFSIARMVFESKYIELADATCYIQLSGDEIDDQTPAAAAESDSTSLPHIALESMVLSNVSFAYTDLQGSMKFSTQIGSFDASPELLDLNAERYIIGSAMLSGGYFDVSIPPSTEPDPAEISSYADIFAPLYASLKQISVRDFDIRITQMDASGKSTKTEINQINIKGSELLATESLYSLKIAEASLQYPGVPALNRLAFDVSIEPKAFSLTALSLSIGQSALRGDIRMAYPNLDALIENYKFSNAIIDLTRFELHPNDLRTLYTFAEVHPDSQMVPAQPVIAALSLSGNDKNINLRNFSVSTGKSSLAMRGTSVGPEWKNHRINIPQLEVQLAKSDLLPFLPEGTDPEPIPDKVKFKGNATAANNRTTLNGKISSEFGIIRLQADAGGWDSEMMHADAYIFSEELNLEKYSGGKLLELCFDLDFSGTDLTGKTPQFTAVLHMPDLQYGESEIHTVYTRVDGKGDKYDFQIELADINAAAVITGVATATDSIISVKAEGTVNGIDFQKLMLTNYDLRLRTHFAAKYEMHGNDQQGELIIDGTVAVKKGERHNISPINARFKLDADSTLAIVKAEYFSLNFNSNMAIDSIEVATKRLFDGGQTQPGQAADYFSFDFKMLNSDMIRELLLDDLETFEPSYAKVDYRAINQSIKASASFPKITYAEASLHKMNLSLEGSKGYLNGLLAIDRVGTDSTYVDDIALTLIPDSIGSRYTFTIGPMDSISYELATLIQYQDENKSWVLNPLPRVLLNSLEWRIDPMAEIELGETDYSIVSFDLRRSEQRLAFAKELDEPTLNIEAYLFDLGQLAGIITSDSNQVAGFLTGDLALNEDGTFTGSGSITELALMGSELGKFSWNASSQNEVYNLQANLTEGAINFSARGVLEPQPNQPTIVDIQVDMREMDLELLSAMLPSIVQRASGTVAANLNIGGTTTEPALTGNAEFKEVRLFLVGNSALYAVPSGSIILEPETIKIPALSIVDSVGNKLTIDGTITHSYFQNMVFDLTLKSQNFTLMDIKPGDDPYLQGKLIVDSDIRITGTQTNPVVVSNVSLIKGSSIVYTLPEEDYKDYLSDDLVEWVEFDPEAGDGIIARKKSESELAVATPTRINLQGFLNIDPATKFKIVMDPLAGDYLMVEGGGKLALSYDRAGRINLSGTYEISSGEYLMTFYNLATRKFVLAEGGRITWNGDPYSADLDIKAMYRARTSIASMMGPQAVGNDAMRQSVNWDVVMNIRGGLEEPEISFEIAIDPNMRGIMGGVVDSRLAQINENENELNKQVFALLIFNTFMIESSGQDSNYLLANQARNSASQILSQQLNQMSDKLIGGVELTFDLQSYAGQAGTAETDLTVDLTKSLFNDRVVVSVGSTMVLEGNSNAAMDNQQFMGNIVIEYKITPDGRYRFKAYSRTDLEDIVVGRINRTGVGILFRREFDKRDEIFKKPENQPPVE